MLVYQVLFILLICHFILLVSGEDDPRIYVCDYTSNYTFGSIFSSSLSIALNTLQNNTSPTGFGTTITNSSQPVTALGLCRGTLVPSDCQTCIDSAVSSIRRVCPNQTSAQVWHTYCMIRYSSTNFINKTDSSYLVSLVDTRDVPDPVSFDQTVKSFAENLLVIAGKYDKRYAIAKTKVSSYFSVYGYVECTRDIEGESCRKCLLSVTSSIQDCCSGKWASWVVSPTCSVQVNMDPVHKDWETAPDISTLLATASAPNMEPEATPPYRNSSDGGGVEGSRKAITIGLVAMAGVLFGIFSVGLLWLVKKSEDKCDHEVIEKEGIEGRSFLFDLDMLIIATDNFSKENMLGRGGFGTVYKGRMADGKEIAVKKLAADSTQGKVEFANEVKVLLKMQHRNLVQLFGCCVQGNEKILVYEYLPNKSLDKFLFDKSKSAILDWGKRFNIIMGVARGLLYLHQDSALRIIHRDIKASNILLDEQMKPKISDFGLARLIFDDEQSRQRTRQVVGTFGYMAPEYAIRGFLSVKSDVFSFGVLMLEIISGRKNFDLQLDTESKELLKLARRLEQEDKLMELVDATIGSIPVETAMRVMQIGLLCTQQNIQDRPTMSSTLSMLSNSSVTIPPAGQPDPGFQGDLDNRNHQSSRNSITISLVNGR